MSRSRAAVVEEPCSRRNNISLKLPANAVSDFGHVDSENAGSSKDEHAGFEIVTVMDLSGDSDGESGGVIGKEHHGQFRGEAHLVNYSNTDEDQVLVVDADQSPDDEGGYDRQDSDEGSHDDQNTDDD